MVIVVNSRFQLVLFDQVGLRQTIDLGLSGEIDIIVVKDIQ